MTVWWDCLAVTLTFDSSPIKEEGILADQVRNGVMMLGVSFLILIRPL